MPKLTILRGLSGSGKSTYADAQVNVVVVSRDALRVQFFGSDGPDYYKHPMLRQREDFITTVEHAAIKNSLKAGFDVISDNTNIETKYMKPIARIAHSLGVPVEVKVFDVPLHTALERNKARAAMGGRNVPETTIRKQHDRFQHTKNSVLAPAPALPVAYSGTPGKPKAFMFDLDGTAYHMNGKRGPFAINVDVDDPDPVVHDVINTLVDVDDEHGNQKFIAIAMSGRKTASREATEFAMDRDGLYYDHLFMRADGDDRPDNIIKAELFDNHVRDNFDVQFVIDDRWQVCEMWLQMGLKVFNVSGLDRGEF